LFEGFPSVGSHANPIVGGELMQHAMDFGSKVEPDRSKRSGRDQVRHIRTTALVPDIGYQVRPKVKQLGPLPCAALAARRQAKVIELLMNPGLYFLVPLMNPENLKVWPFSSMDRKSEGEIDRGPDLDRTFVRIPDEVNHFSPSFRSKVRSIWA
jgi:hypothetical protein